MLQTDETRNYFQNSWKQPELYTHLDRMIINTRLYRITQLHMLAGVEF